MIDSLLNSATLVTLLNILLQVVNTLVSVILLPISLLIKTFLPTLDNILGFITGYLDIALTYAGWVINAMAIPQAVLVLVVGYYIFTTTVSIGIFAVKRAAMWYMVFKL